MNDYDELVRVAGPVSRETFDELKVFEATFLQWGSRINLVAASTLRDVWKRHILDSAQLWALAPHERHWLDLGSGGGFPGLVLAFLLKERPGGRIHLVDSNRKKTAFLQAVTGQFSLPAIIHGKRIGEVSFQDMPEIVTARALAPLPSLLELSSPWLLQGAKGLFHKGREYGREMEESADIWRFDLVEHASKVDDDGVILEIISLQRR